MSRKITKRARLISELASTERVIEDKPSWFRQADYDRLSREWASKSAELVALEIAPTAGGSSYEAADTGRAPCGDDPQGEESENVHADAGSTLDPGT